ncbi:hypothetical protein LTR53_013580 [Teratosphaeriaceae sp. CCFEE 6253]|nr:hypothetical protein LTR53_013580 [Teratosphaeriaceae sp. CCFEE 6253]
MGMEEVEEDMILLLLIPRWSDARYDDVMNAAFVSWTDAMNAANALLGTSESFVHLNYAAPFQDPLGRYGSKSVAFMRAAGEEV